MFLHDILILLPHIKKNKKTITLPFHKAGKTDRDLLRVEKKVQLSAPTLSTILKKTKNITLVCLHAFKMPAKLAFDFQQTALRERLISYLINNKKKWQQITVSHIRKLNEKVKTVFL